MKVRNEVLKEKLKKNSWSQNELAIRVGVARGTISRVMNNKRGAGRKVIEGLLKTFPEETIESLFDTKKN